MCRIAVLLFVCFQGITLWSQPILESLAKSELAAAKGMYQSYAKRSGDAGVDITHAALFMEPDMNSGRIREGSAAFTFTCKASIITLDFDLRTDLRADSIVFNGQQLPFTHLNHVLTVSFPTALLPGTSHSIKIYYQGQPDMSSRAYFRTVNASGPNLSTLSQPYGAPYWWPCRDNLTDKIDSLDIQLRVDTPYTAVSNGVLVSTVNEGSGRLFSFRHRYPIATYLVAVTFSRYTAYTQTASLGSLGKSLNVVNYVFPHNNLNQSMNQTAETAGIMHLFDSLFGSYPFHREQYGHAQFAWGGGMEHQTMSFMVNFSYDLIAHELAHQWFGDMITCGSWKDIWLNEGFATYANLLCYNTPGRDSEWIERLRKNKTEIMSRPDGSVYAYDTGNVSRMFDYRTTYQKGALVLHQLRWVVGDNAFFNAIRAYSSDTGLVYGFALQKDLKHYMELYSGMDLTDYFSDWIMGEGYPEYDIRWQQNGQTLHLEIFQQPSHSSVEAFNVPLPFVIKGLGKDSFIRVPIDGLQTFFNINPGFKVQKVEFDPREWVLAKASLKFPAFTGQEAVSVYPNPFNGRFYVSLTEAEVGSWALYDLCGKQVESARLSAYMPAGRILEIQAEGLAAGIYVLKLETPDSTILRKIIKAD